MLDNTLEEEPEEDPSLTDISWSLGGLPAPPAAIPAALARGLPSDPPSIRNPEPRIVYFPDPDNLLDPNEFTANMEMENT